METHTELCTHVLVKVDSIGQEGWVVDQAEASPVLGHPAAGQHVGAHLQTCADLEGPAVPQAVHHGHHVVVKLTVRLPADLDGLLHRDVKKETSDFPPNSACHSTDRPHRSPRFLSNMNLCPFSFLDHAIK